MITVIQATNRPDSNTEFVSRQIIELLREQYQGPIGYVSMVDLPPEILPSSLYKKDEVPEKLRLIQDQWMIPADKFIWILPEYNGDETFKLKKSMLIGVATGRSGNIRGMDHLSGILMHMKSVIYPRLLPVSRISELMDDQGRIHHAPTLKSLEDHLGGFVAF